MALLQSMSDNPFGKWTQHRAALAAMARPDAGSVARVAEVRRLLKAARLADTILRDRDALTDEQREKLAALLR
jgi:hypothetical protein